MIDPIVHHSTLTTAACRLTCLTRRTRLSFDALAVFVSFAHHLVRGTSTNVKYVGVIQMTPTREGRVKPAF
jgi:hypothetical protein